MSLGLIGKKLGMTKVYTDKGDAVAVTVVDVSGNTLIQVKRSDGKDKYSAVQVGYGDQRFGHDGGNVGQGLAMLARHIPAVTDIVALARLPSMTGTHQPDPGRHWAWEIPGRKRQQIEAFAAAARHSGQPVLDWCGGKGHEGGAPVGFDGLTL